MGKLKKHNQGFSLIELLIAMTILSIVMIMVVQFMSTSSAAYRKTEKNLNIQTEAMKVMEQMSDTLMQAQYIRIVTKDKGMYTIKKTDASNNNVRTIANASSYTAVDYDLVPDSFGNYSENQSISATGRKVIVNFDDYTLCSENKDANGKPICYPLTSDKDAPSGTKVRSFRALKPANDYYYVKPEFIYAEYHKDVTDASGVTKTVVVHVLYHITDITDKKDKTCSIYVYRYQTDVGVVRKGYAYAKGMLLDSLGHKSLSTRDDVDATKFTDDVETSSVLTAIDNGVDGLLTDKISDFYLSADVEGNAVLTNIMFKDLGYQYNVVETINFRNSNVLTVRPQKLFKVKGTGNASGGTSTPTTGSSEASSESGTGATTETP